jgi:hypothetical protein
MMPYQLQALVGLKRDHELRETGSYNEDFHMRSASASVYSLAWEE